ncbi:hypothetical protein [Bradyrhizobium oligotrophicum]|uniref:hypothetical protein n=1 Tax=Bradyrhizobium oligotrophicum TaxID=44255 RepID=UPI003EB79EC7
MNEGATPSEKLGATGKKAGPKSDLAVAHLTAEASAFMQRIIDSRGATLMSYAQVEWYLAKLIIEGKSYDQYQHMKLSFSQDAKTRADTIKSMLKVDGPFSPYGDRLIKAMDDVLSHEELRNYAAHGLLVRPDPDDCSLGAKIHLRRFKMLKGGNLEDANRTLTLKQYYDEQESLVGAAKAFCSVVRGIWKDLNLKNLDE